MHFSLVDAILERDENHIVTMKQVSSAEEYLKDHFPTFPILPGVMMLEAMVQAARELLAHNDHDCRRHVLGQVKALKYGAMIKPGDSIRVEINLLNTDGDFCTFKGRCLKLPAGGSHDDSLETAASGRFTLRPIRTLKPIPVT
ncbi:MAG: 3-hydroxyacyl-ACP dehydratase FabZ family protein [Planctomycetota bacterium]|jgi:3-hydroxyacyl-[acyl-carrier-protein] dehydratase